MCVETLALVNAGGGEVREGGGGPLTWALGYNFFFFFFFF